MDYLPTYLPTHFTSNLHIKSFHYIFVSSVGHLCHILISSYYQGERASQPYIVPVGFVKHKVQSGHVT